MNMHSNRFNTPVTRSIAVLCVAVLFASARAHADTSVWTNHGPEGGAINSLVVDPTTPSTLYAGTPGGLFKSTDSGAHWASINNWPRITSVPGLTGNYFDGTVEDQIRTFAIDPIHSTLYVVTGSAQADRSGLYKSTNGGDAWTHVEYPEGQLDLFRSRSLVVDQGSGALWVGTYRSTDTGDTWRIPQHQSGNNQAAFPVSYAINPGLLAIAPGNPDTLYAVTTEGAFKSTDGGVTWAKPTNVGTNSPAALVVDSTDPNTLYLGADIGVLKSTDGGGTWKVASSGLTFDNYPGLPSIPGIPPPYDRVGFTRAQVLTLAIDPTTPTTLYAGTFVGGVYKSTDGASSWRAVNTGIVVSGGLSISESVGNNMRASIGALAVDPKHPSTLYAGSGSFGLHGKGVFKSTDSSDSWTPVNTGLIATDISAVVVDPKHPSTLYAGSGYGGEGVFKSTDSGVNWSAANVGLSVFAGIPGIQGDLCPGSSVLYCNKAPLDTTFPDVTALVIDPMTETVYAVTSYPGVFKSTDGAATWELDGGLLGSDGKKIHLPNPHTLAVDPITPDTVYVGTFNDENGIYKSTDGTRSWQPSGTGLLANLGGTKVNALAIDPSTPSTLYVGTFGGVYKSTDSGANWSPVNTGIDLKTFGGTVYGGTVKALVIDPITPSTLYIGLDPGVYKSTDSGGHWDPADASTAAGVKSGVIFISVQERAMAIDPSSPGTIYAGTLNGTFESTDFGTNWSVTDSSAANVGLSTSTVFAVAIDPVTPERVYIGVGVKGVFEIGDLPAGSCTGDCNDDHSVTVDELLTLVSMALGETDVSDCAVGDRNHDGTITIDELLTAVSNALSGCTGG